MRVYEVAQSFSAYPSSLLTFAAQFSFDQKSTTLSRNKIVDVAKEWLATPYVHQCSAKGAGCDCLGLVRGVYRDVYGHEPEIPPPYTPDWNERRSAEEPLLTAARAHLIEVAVTTPKPGQIYVFRMLRDGPAKHCGILSSDGRFIHAYAGRAVIESWLNEWWMRRLVGVFEFPGVV